MSDVALAIWISSGTLLVSAGSLLVSVAAYRRSTLRRPDRLSELGRYIANLRPRLERLERTIAEAVQSRARVSAPSGRGLRPGADTAAVREPTGRLHEAAPIPKRVDYAGVEASKPVTARQVGTRLEHLVQYMRDRARRPR